MEKNTIFSTKFTNSKMEFLGFYLLKCVYIFWHNYTIMLIHSIQNFRQERLNRMNYFGSALPNYRMKRTASLPNTTAKTVIFYTIRKV